MAKNKGGRPLKFATAEILQGKIDEYFDWCAEHGKPETIARLAYFLDVDRKTIYNYESNDEYFHTIKKARERILAGLEEALYTESKIGQIFLAKNYGYADKQEIAHTGTVEHTDLRKLNPDQLQNLEGILQLAQPDDA